MTSGEQFVAFDDAGAVPHVLPNHELVGCDATSVLLRRAGHSYSICTDTCRIAELQAKPSALTALSGGHVIAVGVNRTVLAVWREKGAPLFFTLPSEIRPVVVHATEGDRRDRGDRRPPRDRAHQAVACRYSSGALHTIPGAGGRLWPARVTRT